MERTRLALLATTASLALTCTASASASHAEVWRVVAAPDPGPRAHAWASHYGTAGDGFLYQRTASGAVVVPGMMNVAHRTMPFGTRVTVYFGGRQACAVVNDRGPYIAGREFDLGPGTASALRFRGVQWVGWRYGCQRRIRVRASVCRAVSVGSHRVRRCARVWPHAISNRIIGR